MDAERIRAAAEWAKKNSEGLATILVLAHASSEMKTAYEASADAAHILGKLASGEWVLCRGEPVVLKLDGVTIPTDDTPLYVRITEEP